MLHRESSIVAKLAIIYSVITIINIAVFNIIIWENQTDLIIQNASTESKYRGAELKYILDSHILLTGEITQNSIDKIKNASTAKGIGEILFYSEDGQELPHRENQEEVPVYIRRMIHSSITKQSFENRIFTHKLKEKERVIELFIPFTYETDKKGVVHTSVQLDNIDEQMKYLYGQCILITIVMLIIHLLFAALVTKLFIQPFNLFFPVIKDISLGNFNSRVRIYGNDELGKLAYSFNDMCLQITRMQDEAKGANPLTGLPGNSVISKTIDSYLSKKNEFAILYSDLDNFKAYNDKYGFTKGDDVILYTRDKLLEAAKREDVHDILVCHEGGDDFVIITPYDCWETYTKFFIEIFDRGIPDFYNSKDAKRRFIESVNRKGESERFPLIGISIAGVNNVNSSFSHHGEMVSAVAGLKKHVKSQEGSSYKMNERS